MATQTSNIQKYVEFLNIRATGLNTDLFDIDTSLYTYGILNIAGTFTASITIQGTADDGLTWFTVPWHVANSSAPSQTTDAITGPNVIVIHTWFPRIRARITAYTSGTVVASVGFSNATPQFTNITPHASSSGSGTTNSLFRSAAGTNIAIIGAGARKLYGYRFQNTTATPAYFKFYNKGSAPVLASDTPFFTVLVPANGVALYSNTFGKAFSAGIGIACTGLIANTDATATAVDQIIGDIDFI